MADNEVKCPICGDKSKWTSLRNYRNGVFDCNTCGGFSIGNDLLQNIDKDILAPFLYYNCNIFLSPDNKYNFYFLGSKEIFDIVHKDNPNSILFTIDDIYNWYPKNINEKVNYILLGLSKLTNYIGENINFSEEQWNSLYFIKRYKNGDRLSDKECSY